MASAAIIVNTSEITLLARKLSALALDASDRRSIMAALGVELEAETVERFDTKIAPDGTPWKALSDRYAAWLAIHFPGARPQLVVTGELRDTIESQPGDWEVLAGATKIYAARQNFGYENKTPSRPFVGISPENITDLVGVIDDAMRAQIRTAAR